MRQHVSILFLVTSGYMKCVSDVVSLKCQRCPDLDPGTAPEIFSLSHDAGVGEGVLARALRGQCECAPVRGISLFRSLRSISLTPGFGRVLMRGVQKMGCGSALVNSRLTPELFRLRKEHQHARSPVGHQLILLLLRAMRNGQPIAMLVANRLAIHP